MIGFVMVPKEGPLFPRLHCGSGVYTHAICVSVEPFAMVSESGDMLWNKQKAEDFVPLCLADNQIRRRAMDRWIQSRPPRNAPDGCARIPEGK